MKKNQKKPAESGRNNLTAKDLQSIIQIMRARAVGTIFLEGERRYVWVSSKGWVDPGPYKAKMKRALRKGP